MARPVFKAPPRSRGAAQGVRSPQKTRAITPSNDPVPAPDAETVEDGGSMLAARHAPQSCAELALHRTKLAEIMQALDPQSRTRVVILSGLSGSSKSTAVRVICKEQNKTLLEFHAPESTVGSTGIMDSFREFLVGASMYERHSCVVFVDEVPNLFHEDTRRLFEEALIEWATESVAQPIVVVAFTEIEVSARYSEAVVVPRLLGTLVSLREHCRWIKTNAVNATLISKALKLVLLRERRTCQPSVVKSIAQCGDIRNAMNALELYLKSPDLGDAQTLVRGYPTQLFHAVGKVVWGTSDEGSLEKALEVFSETLDTFNLTVLENYCSAHHSRLLLSAAVSASEHLSEADVGVPYLGSLAAAHAIKSSEPDDQATKRFENLKFTQYPKWRREEHESRAKLLADVRQKRLYQGPVSMVSVLIDESAYESMLQKPVDLIPDLSSDDDDDF